MKNENEYVEDTEQMQQDGYAGDERAAAQDNAGTMEQESGGWKDFFRLTLGDLVTVLITIVVAILIVKFVAQPVVVDGHSMDDTLFDGERLMIEKVSRYYDGLKRYDIVVLDPENAEGSLYVKRIIGMPGETVRIDEDGNIYINGSLLEDDVYGTERIIDPGRAIADVVLADDEYFVMGDNRNESLDSRWEEVGNVNADQIIGRVIFEMFPFRKVE